MYNTFTSIFLHIGSRIGIWSSVFAPASAIMPIESPSASHGTSLFLQGFQHPLPFPLQKSALVFALDNESSAIDSTYIRPFSLGPSISHLGLHHLCSGAFHLSKLMFHLSPLGWQKIRDLNVAAPSFIV